MRNDGLTARMDVPLCHGTAGRRLALVCHDDSHDDSIGRLIYEALT